MVALEGVKDGDARSLADLRVAAMRESLERVGRYDATRARERFLSDFNPVCTRHVVSAGDRVGFVVLRRDRDPWLLDHLYIEPGRQGRGLGAAVMRIIFDEADAQGADVRVGALKQSDANRFYLRHGFELVEEGEWDLYYLRRAPPGQDVRPPARTTTG